MSTLPHRPEPLSPSAYLERERRAETRSEYHEGRVVATAGGSPTHNRIAMNVGARLHQLLRDRPCNVYGSDMRVSIDSGRRYVYPDVVVTCGREEMEAPDILTNPLLLVEVPSPSTELYDRNVKLQAYQDIPSLREYVVVSSSVRLVEVFRRSADGGWTYHSSALGDGGIDLKSVEARLALDEVYLKTEVQTLAEATRHVEEHPL